MHIALLGSLLFALATANADDSLLDTEYYVENVAPGQLARLSDYRHQASNLTTDQALVLDEAERIVKVMDVPAIPQLEYDCIVAFGHDECMVVLKGQPVVPGATSMGSVSRGSGFGLSPRQEYPCLCRLDDDNCDHFNGYWCKFIDRQCYYAQRCGSLGTKICDGQCFRL